MCNISGLGLGALSFNSCAFAHAPTHTHTQRDAYTHEIYISTTYTHDTHIKHIHSLLTYWHKRTLTHQQDTHPTQQTHICQEQISDPTHIHNH